jgi:hypothetical protein
MTLANTVNFTPTSGSPTPTPTPPTGQQAIVFANDGGSPTVNFSASDPPMIGDTGSGGLAGNVPAPAAGDAAAGKFLKADGTFSVPGGSGIGTFTQEVVTFSGTSGTLAHTPVSGGFFAIYRNSLLMIPAGSTVQSYSISGASITLSVTAGGDSFYALYYY